MRVLVIGGTNFIGPHVVRRLNRANHEATVFNRGQTRSDVSRIPESIDHIIGDRKNLPEFAERFERLAPEVVLDMIPMNEQHAKALVDTFSGIADRIVAISSQDVYRAYDIVRRRHPGPPDPVPLSENSPLREKLYPYGREGVEEYEKILVEKAVMGNSSIPGTVLRLPAVYGPGDYQHRLFPYLKRMDDGQPKILVEEGMAQWRWTSGYVENVADAIALATTDGRAAGRIYNVGEPDTPPWSEWIRQIGHVANWSGEIVEAPSDSMPEDLRYGGNFSQHLTVSTSLIRQELGYSEKISREEALHRTIAWERESPP
ncbi:MAG: NAD-dependent epimerase/dehydratase family protein [Rubrobacteraceae bacterium]